MMRITPGICFFRNLLFLFSGLYLLLFVTSQVTWHFPFPDHLQQKRKFGLDQWQLQPSLFRQEQQQQFRYHLDNEQRHHDEKSFPVSRQTERGESKADPQSHHGSTNEEDKDDSYTQSQARPQDTRNTSTYLELPKNKQPSTVTLNNQTIEKKNQTWTKSEALPLDEQQAKNRPLQIWQVPIAEPSVPRGFASSESFWNLVYHLAQNASLLPELVMRNLRQNLTQQQQHSVVKIVHWPGVMVGYRTAEHKHVFVDGIQESPYLTLENNISSFDDNLVWIAEPGFGWTWETWCDELTKAVKTAIVQRYEQGKNTRFPLYISDFTDGWGKQRCLEVEKLVGLDLVSYQARSMVGGRHWNDDVEWVDFGSTKEPNLYLFTMAPEVERQVQYRHIPIPVRTDMVEMLEKELKTQSNVLSDPIEELPRPIDVTHFWPLEIPEQFSPVRDKNAELRLRVSQLLHNYGKEMGWNTSIGLAGRAQKSGRQKAQSRYIRAMLQTKILVVTQRDLYEDHYRLMEALISGALVLSDFIHALPAGLHNGTSILLFTSPQDLKALISYYLRHDKERLEIAKRGREVAFSRHRSWHRVEEIIFGRILTTCESGKGSDGQHMARNRKDACPYMVHVSKQQ